MRFGASVSHRAGENLRFWFDFRALFTYEGNSNDLRVAGSGGERVREPSVCPPRLAGRVWGCLQGSAHEIWLAFVPRCFWWPPASAWNGSSGGKRCSLPRCFRPPRHRRRDEGARLGEPGAPGCLVPFLSEGNKRTVSAAGGRSARVALPSPSLSFSSFPKDPKFGSLRLVAVLKPFRSRLAAARDEGRPAKLFKAGFLRLGDSSLLLLLKCLFFLWFPASWDFFF